MKVTLRINYHTNWGESISVVGSTEALGNWETTNAFPLYYNGKGDWEAVINFNEKINFEYKYIVKQANHRPIWEGGPNRVFNCSKFKQIDIRDYWRPQVDIETPLFSKVFSDVLMQHQPSNDIKINASKVIQFNLRAPRVPKGKSIAIIGNNESLGNWKNPIKSNSSNFPIWSCTIKLSPIKFPLYYKYVIIDNKTGNIDFWENGDERTIFYVNSASENICHLHNDEKFRYPNDNWKGAGVAIPIFSLRSEDSFGVGEFNDLKKLVDWSVKTGLKIIQLLPINETVATHSWLDSYPYKAISVFALHPIYLNLDAMGTLEDEKLQDEFAIAKDLLNSKPYVNYVEVSQTKSRFYKYIFDQNWKNVKRTKAFKSFFEENKEWLEPYAAFCFLRDRYQTSDFKEWGAWAKFDLDKIKKLVDQKSKNHEHIAIHYFIQFHLDAQLKEAVAYSHQKGIALKGDIPIGISPNSIEAWTLPKLFNLNGQAGAPPDDFAVLGQNWSFPTYNWEVMANDNYHWWKKRLTALSKYFDAFRIDHILGFFRIWEIPKHALHGLLGYFKPGLPLLTDEILENGIYFDRDRFTRPYIRSHFLHEFFGEYTEEVKKLYLTEPDQNVFHLKPQYNTQRDIFNHFTPLEDSTQNLSEKNVIIRDGLISLLDEVLFIKDPNVAYEAYHPRISMHNSYTYRELDYETKFNLDKLYIDFFYKRHQQFWKNEAMKKLPSLIEASNMLICGEDLGMVPDNVPEVMQELNILSLEIQRMPKNPEIEFGHPNDAPYLSVCTTSTHDMTTLRGWWEENKDKTQRFYHNMMGHNNKAPFYAEPWICREIINQHLYSPSMWTIFPIQDLIAMDGELRWDETDKERINVPSDEKNKWRYRMILSLEELLNADEFNLMFLDMVNKSGRNSDI
ncbi:MAG: 4-alpha-glucanotransferase [Prolixibacteraceae bacterium]|jgi:4-alpha-glucanotransferase|nr:4-alpha-glucanotransferase [Prolixibacteraceae bacterium]